MKNGHMVVLNCIMQRYFIAYRNTQVYLKFILLSNIDFAHTYTLRVLNGVKLMPEIENLDKSFGLGGEIVCVKWAGFIQFCFGCGKNGHTKINCLSKGKHLFNGNFKLRKCR